jgi:hypothetical protein
MNNIEKKLREAKLPYLRLEENRRTFFKHLFRTPLHMPFNSFPNIRIREIVMVSLIVMLTVINFWKTNDNAYPQSELAFAAQIKEIQVKVAEVSETVIDVQKSVAALRPNSLAIIPLYNGIANRIGESDNDPEWILIPEYEIKLALFAVLPAGIPPYSWSIDDPSIMSLFLTPEGFIAKGQIKRSGHTILRVKDSSGLSGTLPITTESMSTPLEAVSLSPIF